MKDKIILGIVILVVSILTSVAFYFIFPDNHECPEPPKQKTIEQLYADTQRTIKRITRETEHDIELIGRERHEKSFYKNVYIHESRGGYAKFYWNKGSEVIWGGKYLVTSRSWMDTTWNTPKIPSLFGGGNVMLNKKDGRIWVIDDSTYVWLENDEKDYFSRWVPQPRR